MANGTTHYRYYTHPECGHTATVEEPDGTIWYSAKTYIDFLLTYACQNTNIDLIPDEPTDDDIAAHIFSRVPSRFKEKKLFLTEKGFQESLGITSEGLDYYFKFNLKVSDLNLIKKESS
jgi:hypothetical protein